MKKNTLIGGLRIAMQALAGKSGIALTFSGNTAYTDGKNINLPCLDNRTDEAVAVLARGYVDHEAAHIRFTNFATKNSMWANILEDVRIEREMTKEWPGAGVNLKKLVSLLKKDDRFLGDSSQPVSVLQSWALCWGRSHVLKQDLADFASQMKAQAHTLFGSPFCDAFDALLHKLPGCNTTEDCVDLAREIEDLIQNPPQPPQEQQEEQEQQEQNSEDNDNDAQSEQAGDSQQDEDSQQNGQSGDSDEDQQDSSEQDDQQGQDSDCSQGQDDGSGEGNSESDSGGDSEGGSEGNSEGNTASKQQANDQGGSPCENAETSLETGQPSSSGGSGQGLSAQDIQDNLDRLKNADSSGEDFDLGKMLGEQLSMAADNNSYQPQIANTFEGEQDYWGDVQEIRYKRDKDLALLNIQDEILQAKQKTAQLRAGLSGLLQSIRLQNRRRTSSGHRISRNSCHLIGSKTPDTRVFLSRNEQVDNNTAVAILIDSSSSMECDNRMSMARQSTFAITEALSSFEDIKTIVGHFPAAWNSDPLARSGVKVIKGFDEKLNPKQFAIPALGGTPLNEALLWGGMQLSNRKEPRKILLVLTDGELDRLHYLPVTHQVVKRIEDSGVEVYGIGIIEADATSWLAPGRGVNIKNIADLPKSMIKILKQALVEQRRGR